MTFATFLLVLIGHRVTIAQRLLVREILLVNQLGGLVRLAIGIVLVATAIQVVGFLALFARFYFLYPPAEAVWQAAFHSVSGFNGAGFVVLNEPNQLMDFQGDIAILGILTLLIFIGAISYLVIIDLVRYRRFSPLTLNTKLVLVFTAALTLIGIVGFLGPEYGNPQTLGPMPVGEKIAATLFQVNSGRTAGFTVFDLGDAHEHTNLLTAVLMFIGGASASVAGGIKLNTIAVIFLAVAAILRGSNNVSAYGREIPFEQVQTRHDYWGNCYCLRFRRGALIKHYGERLPVLRPVFRKHVSLRNRWLKYRRDPSSLLHRPTDSGCYHVHRQTRPSYGGSFDGSTV